MNKQNRRGRPRKEDVVFWGVRLDKDTVEAIREAAKLANSTQGEVIRKAIQATLS